MCGICGLYNIEGGDVGAEARDIVRDMAGMLRHRGPDEEGFYCHGPAALGHTRLSIIDLSTGQQPMGNEDGSVWVVFNGEIFNYVELRAELETKGHQLRTTSDTEVLVHLYEDLGPDMLGRLNGQFAMAIYDARDRSLFMARDPFGICPLFYCREGGLLAFASEIKAMLALPGIRLELDPLALSQVFTLWTVLSPRTPFAGIRSLPPGHWVKAGPDWGFASPRCYWHMDFPPAGEEKRDKSEEAWAEEVEESLVEAVRLRLRADVPVGVYLSGGLDSSIISTVVKRLTPTPIEAFSLFFAEASYDESAFQKRLAQAIGVRHNSVLVQNHQIGQVFTRVIWHGERPVLRAAPAPLFLLSELVRENGFKVVLTGEGADEIFGGYDIFKEDKIRRFWARCPESPCRPLLLNRLYPHAPLTTIKAGRMLAAFYRKDLLPTGGFGYSHRPTWNNTRPLMAYFSEDLRAAIGDYDPVEDLKALVPERFATWHPLHQAQFLEARLLLSEYLLSSQGERMTMGHSVEGRYPFLDPNVVSLATRIPPHLKLKGLKEKYILRKAFEGLLHPEITRRPKRPYLAPNKESFLDHPDTSKVYDNLSPERLARSGLFDEKKVQRLVEKCAKGGQLGFRDNAGFLGILSTQIIWEKFVAREPVSYGENA
jgi:asparagine synthase (glutamine-hydrolysing)